MSDLEPVRRSKITGKDEVFDADVISEKGFNKLFVKATSAPDSLGNLFFEHVEDNGNPEMAVNGNSPKEYTIAPHAAYDRVVKGLAFHCLDGGMKLENFLGKNSAISNGILIEIKSEDQIFQFPLIKTTQEFDAHFAWGEGRSFDLVFGSGGDSLVTRYGQDSPFIIKAQGTYVIDDYIKVTIQDNLSTINSIRMLAFGSLDI